MTLLAIVREQSIHGYSFRSRAKRSGSAAPPGDATC